MYLVLCSKNSVYVGKTVCPLSIRINGHRTKYNYILASYNENNQFSPHGPGDVNVDNVLGAHLFTVHHKRGPSDFDNYFKFDILCTTTPENLRKSEQFYIDKLNSLYPLGLNNIKSVSGK